MAITRLLQIMLLLCVPAMCGLHDPFPFGSGMMNLGTIVQGDDLAARDPWTPATFFSDSLHWSIGAAGIVYYDKMDNAPAVSTYQGGAGGLVRIRSAMTVKFSYARFSSMDIYYEDQAGLSVASESLRPLLFGADIHLLRRGLTVGEHRPVSGIYVGGSLFLPLSFAAFSLQTLHPLTHRDQSTFHKPPRAILGIHSRTHRLGAQGIALTMTDYEEPEFAFAIGQRFALHEAIAIDAALGANPFLIAVGLSFFRTSGAVFGGLVHHPELGWSRGMGAGWAR